MAIDILSSYDNFRELRTNKGYYVDKTDFLVEYFGKPHEKAVLFARPRRFGKTLTMTMMRDFLDIRQNSEEIFEGLKIMDHPGIVGAYMNQYPVVFLSLKEVFGDDFDGIFRSYQIVIASLCRKYEFLLESEKVSRFDKSDLEKLMRREESVQGTTQVLGLLARMLHDHYQKTVFMIIDEYDVPMAKAVDTAAYEKVRNMIEQTLSFVCKTNENVNAVLLSGCLYTVKNSAYTGVNNILPFTVLSPLYASSIGFTDGDVRKLLTDAELLEWYDVVEEWYDGYLFGRERMYCPWDVLLFVRSVLDGSYSQAVGPESYWINTSETSLTMIHGFLGKTPGVNEQFEQLLAGNPIECMVNEHLPYHRIHESGDNLWSALLETGYLTKAVPEKMTVLPLRIPNREIRDVFRQEVWSYFQDKVDNAFVRDLVNALWADEVNAAQAALAQILEATLSFYHEYHEYSYHLILDGFFTGCGYRVHSELETGYGRSDLIIQDTARMRAILIELKHVDEEKKMRAALNEAASQIIREKYWSQLAYDGYSERHYYAMAFCGKKVLIAKVQY